MTHAELVDRAERWLQRRGCQVVVTAATIMTHEQPDAIGYTPSGWTTVVECKASRADFRRDQKKWHRRTAGMGNRRYYLTPADMVRAEEVPDGWGLLYCLPRGIRVIKDVEHRTDRNLFEEMKYLLAEVRRMRPDQDAWASP